MNAVCIHLPRLKSLGPTDHQLSASPAGKEWKKRSAVASFGNLLVSLSDPGFLS